MARKKKAKEPKFDFKEYVNENFDNPKAFIYYLITNRVKINNEKELEKIYKQYKILGGI